MSGCSGHSGLSTELRAVVLLALDRFGPVLERVGTAPASGPSSCASCPVCAVLAALRGERPELAVRIAEHATGLVTALRAALHEPAAAASSAPTRPVQRIPVERVRAARWPPNPGGRGGC